MFISLASFDWCSFLRSSAVCSVCNKERKFTDRNPQAPYSHGCQHTPGPLHPLPSHLSPSPSLITLSPSPSLSLTLSLPHYLLTLSLPPSPLPSPSLITLAPSPSLSFTLAPTHPGSAVQDGSSFRLSSKQHLFLKAQKTTNGCEELVQTEIHFRDMAIICIGILKWISVMFEHCIFSLWLQWRLFMVALPWHHKTDYQGLPPYSILEVVKAWEWG